MARKIHAGRWEKNWSTAQLGPSNTGARWLFFFSLFSSISIHNWKFRLPAPLRQAVWLLLYVFVKSYPFIHWEFIPQNKIFYSLHLQEAVYLPCIPCLDRRMKHLVGAWPGHQRFLTAREGVRNIFTLSFGFQKLFCGHRASVWRGKSPTTFSAQYCVCPLPEHF